MPGFDFPEYKVSVDQLVIGVYIRFEAGWFDHPFFFNRFKITSRDQIRTLKGMGLKEVTVVPAKSDRLPVSGDDGATKDAAEGDRAESRRDEETEQARQQSALYAEQLWEQKKARIALLKEKKSRLVKTREEYAKNLKELPNILQNIVAAQAHAVEQASSMVQTMVESLVGDPDSVVQLMDLSVADDALHYHSLNVSVLGLIIAREANLDEETMRHVGIAGLLHDIGKHRFPKKLLRKPPPYSKPELELLRMHPRYGAEMLAATEGIHSEVVRGVLQHHERMNATGYPAKLKGSDIGSPGRIVAIANTYDKLCNAVDPAHSRTPHQALSILYSKLKHHVDPAYLSLFIRRLGVYPPGSILQLSNQMIGLVVSVNSRNPLKPSLLLYDPEVPKDEAIIFEMEDDPDLEVNRTFSAAELPPQILSYLNPRTRITYFIENPEGQGG